MRRKSKCCSLWHAALLTACSLACCGHATVVDIDTSQLVFRASDGGEAGIMYDIGFLFTTSVFTNATFLQRLADLSRGGGQAMRLGGGQQICVVYNVTGELQELPTHWHAVSKYCHGRLHVLNATLWDAVLDAMELANMSLVLGVNAGVGRPWTTPGPWDPAPSGFPSLVDYTMKRRGRVMAYELGNEPYKMKFGYNVPMDVLASDCATMKKLLRSSAAKHGIADPPMAACPDFECDIEPDAYSSHAQEKFFGKVDSFVNLATQGADAVDALTLHWYGVKSRNPNVSGLALVPERLDKFGAVFRRFPAAASQGWAGEVWAGETAEVQQGGKDGVSNAWSSSLWLYDQLGQQGEVGVARMLRTCVACANYNMLDMSTFAPAPDFYTTVLWRQVVGPGVLRVRSPSHLNSSFRLYARCSRHKEGWVSVIAVNLGTQPEPLSVSPRSAAPDALASLPQQRVFQLGPGDSSLAHSKTVALNGAPLALLPDGKMPEMSPKLSDQGSQVLVEPLGAVLLEYDAEAAACMPTTAHTRMVQV